MDTDVKEKLQKIAAFWLSCKFLENFKEIGIKYLNQVKEEKKNGKQCF